MLYDPPAQILIDEIDEENTAAFYDWAFGPDFDRYTKLEYIPELWNSRHPENPINPGGNPREDVKMMAKLWRNVTVCPTLGRSD